MKTIYLSFLILTTLFLTLIVILLNSEELGLAIAMTVPTTISLIFSIFIKMLMNHNKRL